ncbi:MAG TPA: hypothetical protein DD618_00840 [Acholeplasmatales bacterium]|nr:hypothetical protein [Acholeplasmatales bacterium]
MEKTEFRIALMIDSENVSTKYIRSVMAEIAKYGKIVISRFYGDVKSISKDWQQTAMDFAIKPVHQYNVATGKNAADMAMALDAQEIMYQDKVNAFFLVSSDSDFTPLAMKLKEGGMYVIGVGNENATAAFKNACNEFKYFKYLDLGEEEEEKDSDKKTEKKTEKKAEKKVEELEEPKESKGSTAATFGEIAAIIKGIIIENGVDNKMLLSVLGTILVNRFSDFDPRKYGVKNLSSLVNTIDGLSIIQEDLIAYVVLNTKIGIKDVSQDIIDILSKSATKEMDLTEIKQELEKKYPKFSYQELGFTKFSKLVSSINQVTVKSNSAKLKA